MIFSRGRDILRVLITTEFYLPFKCGVTSAVSAERSALEREGDEVRVLTIGGNRKSFYDDDVKCYYIAATLPRFYKDSYASLNTHDPLIKDVLSWGPEIIHSQSEFFSFRFASSISRRLSIPIVHTCHTDFVSYTVHFTRFTRTWNYFASIFIPLFIRRAKRLICSTDKIYNLISSYKVKQPIDRILVAIDRERFLNTLSLDEKRDMRRRYSISDDDFVFLSVSRLSREKNVMEIINLFSSLVKTEKNVKLLIVGDGEERTALENEVKNKELGDKVIFTGEVDFDSVWKYYQISDLLVGASSSETECLSNIEAMSSALPILVKNDSVLSSYLVGGKNGFSYNSEKEFLSLSSAIISSPEKRREIGEAARRTSEEFSLPIFAGKLHECFYKALKEK